MATTDTLIRSFCDAALDDLCQFRQWCSTTDHAPISGDDFRSSLLSNEKAEDGHDILLHTIATGATAAGDVCLVAVVAKLDTDGARKITELKESNQKILLLVGEATSAARKALLQMTDVDVFSASLLTVAATRSEINQSLKYRVLKYDRMVMELDLKVSENNEDDMTDLLAELDAENVTTGDGRIKVHFGWVSSTYLQESLRPKILLLLRKHKVEGSEWSSVDELSCLCQKYFASDRDRLRELSHFHRTDAMNLYLGARSGDVVRIDRVREGSVAYRFVTDV